MRKQIRGWTQTVETVVVEIMSGQRGGKLVAVARLYLCLLSKVYITAIKLRRFLKSIGRKRIRVD
jgi:hypothetical protein